MTQLTKALPVTAGLHSRAARSRALYGKRKCTKDRENSPKACTRGRLKTVASFTLMPRRPSQIMFTSVACTPGCFFNKSAASRNAWPRRLAGRVLALEIFKSLLAHFNYICLDAVVEMTNSRASGSWTSINPTPVMGRFLPFSPHKPL